MRSESLHRSFWYIEKLGGDNFGTNNFFKKKNTPNQPFSSFLLFCKGSDHQLAKTMTNCKLYNYTLSGIFTGVLSS